MFSQFMLHVLNELIILIANKKKKIQQQQVSRCNLLKHFMIISVVAIII